MLGEEAGEGLGLRLRKEGGRRVQRGGLRWKRAQRTV